MINLFLNRKSAYYLSKRKSHNHTVGLGGTKVAGALL